MGAITRRVFIGAGALIGGGLALGVGGLLLAPNRLTVGKDSETNTAMNTWLQITPDNRVIVTVPHSEIGQGAVLGLAMMLAEELDADWQAVEIEEAPAEHAFANGYLMRGFAAEAGLIFPEWLENGLDFATFKVADMAGMQFTGGSISIRATGEYGMRVAGAAARAVLLEAAADNLGVSINELSVAKSRILHAASGRSVSFGEVANVAAQLTPPSKPRLKQPSQFTLVGTPQPRRDIPAKVAGTSTYGVDIDLPDMLCAAVRHSPVIGAQPLAFDEAALQGRRGIHKVVSLDGAVAVVADSFWRASQALDVLNPEFGASEYDGLNSEAVYAAHRVALDELDPIDIAAEQTSHSAEYRVPYLAHATMEPMAATARVVDGRCEVWAGTQDPLKARITVAESLGLPLEQVAFHNLHSGGGFGRRLPGAFDYVVQAAMIAQAVSPRPVKLIWSRDQDMRNDFYRDVTVAKFQASVDEMGKPIHWAGRFTSSSMMDASAAKPFYQTESIDMQRATAPNFLRIGSWRSVAFSQHVFFMESFVDELAHAASVDPVDYRLSLLEPDSRHYQVLQRVVQMSPWRGERVPGRGYGVALASCFGSVIAQIAEVSVSTDNNIQVHRVWAAVDCGYAVNPNQAMAQVQGGIHFGLSAALYQAITLDNGRIQQSHFGNYQMVQLATAPRVAVEFVELGSPLGGLGEPGVPPIAPAVANAVFALTGQRLRELPLQLNA